ncbi:acyl carrier protein [Cellulosilyticum sp. I15G10I2]|uniref:acyl carrier protein n=1 Tax=Cellulosilyticum sp. I15G10I2 TaxID=1892843 RepID=UPI00085BD3E5|nr:acyl carrier protein [Cellulosilyticum sp. I15G10I2]
MVFEKVKQIISEQFNISEDELTLYTSFVDDLNADSLDIFQIIMAIEEEFEIEISNDDAERVSTVGDVVEYIKEQKGLD